MSIEFETAYRLMLSELLPSLMHEFNNPLTAIGAVPGLLNVSKNQLDPGDVELVESLQASVDTIHRLLAAARRLLQADTTSNYTQAQPLLESLILIMGPHFRRSRITPTLQFEETPASVNLASRYVALFLYCALEVCQRLARKADIKVFAPCELTIASRQEQHQNVIEFRNSLEMRQGLPDELLKKLDGAALIIDAELWQDQPIFARIMATEHRLENDLQVESQWRVLPDGVHLRMMFP